MTTVRQLVTDAFRESGLIAAGETPEADQFAEALRKLQSLISSLFGNEFGEQLITISYGNEGISNVYGRQLNKEYSLSTTYIPPNARVVFNISDSKTLYFPPSPDDGARIAVLDNAGTFDTAPVTLDGNGRLIEGTDTVTLSTANLAREWFYRADLGTWMRVSALTADSESPFPNEFDDLLSTWLSFRLNPRYGVAMTVEATATLQRMQRLFRARYRQRKQMPVEEALLRLTNPDYWGNYTSPSPEDRFNNGIF